jgi:transcriptional regulator with XRE-family HTH domain
MQMIGARLREARETRGLSLTDVAGKAHVSAATLSRIENNKQGLDFGLFLILAKVLDVAPAELVGADDQADAHDPLVARIAQLSTGDRARLWNDLAAATRNSHRKRYARHSATLSQQMEELFAQFDFIREELEAVRTRIRKPRRLVPLTVSSGE